MDKAIPLEELLFTIYENIPKNELIEIVIGSEISFAITKARVDKGLDRKETASLLGVSLKTFDRWENGDFNFTIKHIGKICATLDIDFTEWFKIKKGE